MANRRTPSRTTDLFSTTSTPERPPSSNPSVSSPPTTNTAGEASSTRYVLPRDLPSAMKQLEDQELDQLLEAVLAEQRRRGRKSPAPDESSRKRRGEAGVPLTVGKLNARRLQSWRHAVTNCATIRNFPVGCAESAGASRCLLKEAEIGSGNR